MTASEVLYNTFHGRRMLDKSLTLHFVQAECCANNNSIRAGQLQRAWVHHATATGPNVYSNAVESNECSSSGRFECNHAATAVFAARSSAGARHSSRNASMWPRNSATCFQSRLASTAAAPPPFGVAAAAGPAYASQSGATTPPAGAGDGLAADRASAAELHRILNAGCAAQDADLVSRALSAMRAAGVPVHGSAHCAVLRVLAARSVDQAVDYLQSHIPAGKVSEGELAIVMQACNAAGRHGEALALLQRYAPAPSPQQPRSGDLPGAAVNHRVFREASAAVVRAGIGGSDGLDALRALWQQHEAYMQAGPRLPLSKLFSFQVQVF